MAVTAQIANACQEMTSRLNSFRQDATRVTDLQWCIEKLNWLRAEYRADPAALADSLVSIKELSRQVREVLLASSESLTASYLDAARQAAAWESYREACRDALVELASDPSIQRLESPQGWIEIKRSRSVTLPKSGSSQREQLLNLISQAQRWPDVALPNGARLLKALDGGLFSADIAEQIARLCPAQTICRLATHSKD